MFSESELASEIERSFDLSVGLRDYEQFQVGEAVVEFRSVGRADPSSQKPLIWQKLRHEMYTLLCTDDSKYDKERKLLETEAKAVVVAMASAIGSTFGVAGAIATSMVVLGLAIPLKIGVNAWCEYYKSGELDGPEKAAVKELADKLVEDDR